MAATIFSLLVETVQLLQHVIFHKVRVVDVEVATVLLFVQNVEFLREGLEGVKQYSSSSNLD